MSEADVRAISAAEGKEARRGMIQVYTGNGKGKTTAAIGMAVRAVGAGQKVMADALGVPVAVQATAGEGGPWGMAVLAAYMANRGHFCGLQQFLTDVAFQGSEKRVETPTAAGRKDFEQYLEAWKACLPVEKEAVQDYVKR